MSQKKATFNEEELRKWAKENAASVLKQICEESAQEQKEWDQFQRSRKPKQITR